MSSIYDKIVDDIKLKISKGKLRHGEKLFSINDICKYYDVSRMTSIKAINELKGLGLIHGIKGKGLFVSNGNSNLKTLTFEKKAIEKIVIFTVKEKTKKGSFLAWIMNGIYNECIKNRIDHRTEYLMTYDSDIPHTAPLKFYPAEGVISVCGLPFMRQCTAGLEQGAQVVLVDSIISGFHSILTDNHRGIADTLDYLTGLGHKRILLASHFGHSQNFINENERSYAFQNELRWRKIQGEIITGPNFDNLLNEIKSSRSTAVMFTQDAPALKFINIFKKHRIKVPLDLSVTGFDGNSQTENGQEFLTTLEVDCAEMGRASVKSFFEPVIPDRCGEKIIRIPGKLVIRKSSAKVKS